LRWADKIPGEWIKVLRWMEPRRMNSACSRPGIRRKTRSCAPYFNLV